MGMSQAKLERASLQGVMRIDTIPSGQLSPLRRTGTCNSMVEVCAVARGLQVGGRPCRDAR
jgi:hypothetical protein